ncbi:hypothetical protein ACHWQZ_G013427 [Mnemiopsis leidyi]
MPRLVNCIKNCCFSLLLIGLISAVCSLFVWQAEVYQSTIDEQVRLMKLDISAMKKENHLMEIKLNEQYGKHEDLKEEFRYLLKQAKWSVSGDIKDDKRNDLSNQDTQGEERDKVKTFNKPELQEDKKREAGNQGNGEVDNALQDALRNLRNENEFDLSKRTHILIVSEKRGGGHVLSKLIAHDENIFFLPSISSVIKSSKDFDKVAHCTITDGVVEYYKTHIGAALTSKSLAKFCPEGKCNTGNFTAENLERECMSKHVAVLEGSTENWSLAVLDSLAMEIAYVRRDPRAIISRLLEDGDITEEEVQVFAGQLCARVDSFSSHTSSTHNVYQVFDYKKIAASPVTSLSQLYYKLLDTTHIPDIQLTKEYKNELYLSIGEWKNKLPTIIVDAVNEECKTVLDTLSQ